MNTLVRWLVGVVWAGWGVVPALFSARPAADLLGTYAWCLAVAVAAVTVLWIATLAFRR